MKCGKHPAARIVTIRALVRVPMLFGPEQLQEQEVVVCSECGRDEIARECAVAQKREERS